DRSALYDSHLDGVDDLGAGADGTDDDHGVAAREHLPAEEGLDGQLDVSVEIMRVELEDDGNDAPMKGKFLGDVLAFADGVDDGMAWAKPGEVASHAAA